ncbi:MAG: LysR family transcriptional regulator [Alcaligenaceae bacterium]|nr:LysR family transcriptional regulator [Alcaligenaceae bacterium]
MLPNLRQLQAFVLICRLGSLTRAAEQMCLTQAAVSVLVKQCEEALGIALFDRGSRTLQPTTAARALLDLAERALRDVETLGITAQQLRDCVQGQLRVGVTSAVACTLLPHVIKAFRAAYPGVRVFIHDLPPDQLILPVLREEVDFSIGTPDAEVDDLDQRLVFRDYMSVVFCAGSPLENLQTVCWADIQKHETVTVRRGSRIRSLIERALVQNGLDFAPSYEVSFLTTALSLTAEGVAVSILPSYLVSSFQYPNLRARRLVEPEVSRDLYVLSMKGRTLTPAANQFINLLMDTVSGSQT